MRADEPRDIAFRRIILSIPPGKVSTYGRVATAKFQRLEGRIDVGSLPQKARRTIRAPLATENCNR
jgi:alkylated DNA nucleotide flippase Atl1